MFAQRKTRSEGSVPKTVAKETVAGGGGTINKKKDNNNKKKQKNKKKNNKLFLRAVYGVRCDGIELL